MKFLPISTTKFPLIVPGSEAAGFVASMIFLPVATTPFPS